MEGEGERKKFSFCCFTPQMAIMARTELFPTLELHPFMGEGAQVLGPSSAAFSGL